MSEVQPQYKDFHAWVEYCRENTRVAMEQNGDPESDDYYHWEKQLDALDDVLGTWHYITAIGLNKTSEERFRGMKTRPLEIQRPTRLDPTE